MKKTYLKKVASLICAISVFVTSQICATAYYAPAIAETGNLTGREMSKSVAEEGMVLLKNSDNALPLSHGEKVAVFGINQVDFIHGGGGSGNFTSEYYVSLIDALKERSVEGEIVLYDDLLSMYQSVYDTYWATDGRTYAYGSKQGAVIMYQGETAITSAQAFDAAAESDTAIITIGRPAGESGDRSSGKGDFLLSDKENDMISKVKAAGFKKIVVVLNVCGVMETTWLQDNSIDAALLCYLPGMEGGNAMADVLLGDSYPSGKLVDTWAKSYSDYPSSKNFGNGSYANYEEDIFVGYRYFETIPSAYERVNYEFGYGLSYADFTIDDVDFAVNGSGRNRTVTVSATVTNTSDTYSGKEVVQIYSASPENKLTQPKKELCAFEKTSNLAPHESERVNISFDFDSIASYDDVGKTDFEAAYVLESGEYNFYIGSSVRRCSIAGQYTLSETECVEQLAHRMVPDTTRLTRRLTSDGTYEALAKTTAAERTAEEAEEIYQNPPASDDKFLTFNEVSEQYSENKDILKTFVSRLTSDELIKLVGCTNPVSNKGHRTGIGGLTSYNVPLIGTSNGPAGIQYNGGSQTDSERNTTFFPCATMQASTWNTELIEMLGVSMALEARHFEMSLWQAPGMNIHRDILCGRNFEYFSEDPLITGRTGAAITKGVQSQDFASQPKHFALNNQETGRFGNDSRVSERALREIYLKGFEITVKEAHPWSMMSSYNKINGTYSSANYELLTEVLRNEWGFDGFVMTDFNTSASHVNELIAGGDLRAPAAAPQPSSLKSALESGTIKRWQLERSAENVLGFIVKTQDAKALIGEDFDYSIAVSFLSNSFDAGSDRIYFANTVPIESFMSDIDDHYNQTYELFSKDGDLLAYYNKEGSGELVTLSPTTPLSVGMTLTVTAENGLTSKDFTLSTASLSLNKSVRVTATESGNSAAYVVDGNSSTRWSAYLGESMSNGIYTNFGNWLEIDLGEIYNISNISMLFYNDSSRTYTYEVWGKKTNEPWDSSTAKDKDLENAGYTLLATQTSVSDDESDRTTFDDTVNARYILIKVTNGTNAKAPSIYECDIFGWRLQSSEYAIDDEVRTIYVPKDTLLSDAMSHLSLYGNATMTFDADAAWLGNHITITDDSQREITYNIVTGENRHSELLDDCTVAINGSEKSSVLNNVLRASSTGGSYPAAADRYAFVKFDISNLDSDLIKSILSLNVKTKSNKGNPTYTLYEIPPQYDSWESSSITGDNSSELISASSVVAIYKADYTTHDVDSSYGTIDVNSPLSFTVTEAVANARKNGRSTISFFITADTCATVFDHSSEGKVSPSLVSTYSSAYSFSASLSGESVTVYYSNYADSLDVIVTAACYNDSSLVNVATKSVTIASDVAEGEFNMNVTDSENIKLYVWDKNLVPLCEPITLK